MTFAQLNLDDNIFKAISLCGYKDPTPIQSRSIPDILKGKDLVASAQTGTGKTAAFVLPALHRISLQKGTSKPRVLILSPTRELATQITDAISKYGKFLRFNMANLVGGMPYRQQLRNLSRPVDIIVATPGRLLDHMENRRVDLSNIEMLVLDEADRMLDMGFIDDVREIAKHTPESRQTLLFSATINDRLSKLINNLLKTPVRIDLSSETMSPTMIKQKLYYADNMQHKTQLLQHFLTNESIFKAIIFSATKVNADDLANQLCKQGFEAAPLHGDLKQAVRNKTIERLRRGKIQYLVATDVAARGIDVQDITHVFNYDLPKFSEDYVHRIGRTGRAGKSGVAISFASPLDVRHLQKIERYTGQKLEVATIVGLEPSKRKQSGEKHKSKKHGSGKKHFGEKRYSDKPFSEKRFGEKRRSDKPFGEKRSSDKPFSEKRFGEKRRSDKPSSEKRHSDKPFGEKRFGEKRRSDKSFGEKRSSDKPFGEKRFGEKRRSDKPFGEKRRSDKPFSEKRHSDEKRRSDDRSSGEKRFGEKRHADKSFGKKRFNDKPFKDKIKRKKY